MGAYLKWFNQTLKNYYSTDEMKLSGWYSLTFKNSVRVFEG